MSIKYFNTIKKLFSLFFSILFPDYCLSCQKILDKTDKYVVCIECEKILINKGKNSKICLKCSRLLSKQNKSDICPECEKANFIFSANYSLGSLTGIWKDFVYSFKFKDQNRLANFFAHYISKYFSHLLKDKILVTVPDSYFDRFKKGKASVHYLGRILSQQYNYYYHNILKKVKNCRKQKTLKRKARYDNVKNAFRVKKESIIRNKDIVLIDDVFTTGATVNECSKVLLTAGAKSVTVLTIAREN